MVAIVKYNAGNVYSVVNAVRRLGVEPVLSDDAEVLRRADHVIFPGQGEARGAMEYLRSKGLDEVIRSLSQPVLGICIGQQLLCRHSEEGDVDCLGIFDVDVKRFQPQRHEDKVPCMGWNLIEERGERLRVGELCSGMRREERDLLRSNSKLFEGLREPWVYFVHSYYVPLCEHTIASANYILPYSAALHKDNFYTCQFHPEKSGEVGEKILANFLKL